MKKGDIVVMFILIGIIAGSFVWIGVYGDNTENLSAVIKIDGELYKEIKLTDNYNNFIEINSKFGYNKIDIQGKTVRMAEADCEDGLCVKRGEISKPFQSIVCLPCRLIVYIEGDTELHYVSY